jgi:hypothetical protein
MDDFVGCEFTLIRKIFEPIAASSSFRRTDEVAILRVLKALVVFERNTDVFARQIRRIGLVTRRF